MTGAQVWQPTAQQVADARVTGLMRSVGIADLVRLRAESIADAAWFWNAVVDDLGIPFSSPTPTSSTRRVGWPSRAGSSAER